MNYEEFAPPPSLQWLVRCFWTLSAPAGARAPEPALPDGCPELIFNLGDPFVAQGSDGLTQQPMAMLVGQITCPMAVAPSGRVDLLAARFTPCGASLLQRRMALLTDRWVDVTPMSPHLATLRPVLAAVSAMDERLHAMSLALERVASDGPAPDRRVRAAVARIEATDGTVPIGNLASELDMTARHMQRLFADFVGISPKLLCRIRRFQRVFAAWRDDPGNWAAVAVRCGYFDQAHLARDFAELGGSAPAGFVAALPEFTRLFTALGPAGER